MGLDLLGLSPMYSENIPICIQSGPTCFHLKCVSCLHLSKDRNSFNIHTDPFTLLPDFLLIERHCSWNWGKWSLAVNHLSWTPFSYSACFQGILPRTSLKRLKLALLKPIVAILLPALSPPCLVLNANAHGHCSQGCPQPSHLQPWRPSLFVSMRLRSTLFLVGAPLPVSGSCYQWNS